MKRILVLAGLLAALLQAAPAAAVCSAANTYRYSFNGPSNVSMNYANTYNYTATSTGGANLNFTVNFGTNGLSSNVAGGVALPAINTLISGAAGGRTLVMGGIFSSRTANITSNTRTIRTIFTFPTPIRDMTLTVHDIDFASNQFRDWLHIVGTNGALSYKPTMVTPHGTNNIGGPVSGGGSSLALGLYNAGGVNVSDTDRAAGLGAADNAGDDDGDITISFAEPVTVVTLRYGNYPLTSGESATGQQAYGISAVSFCPMPVITTIKSSAPLATTGPDRFNTPGSDVVYSIQVINSGGSPVDLNGLTIGDTLPTTVEYYNGDFDPSAPGTDPFQLTAGTSGVTLTAANVTYSNNNGATYTYTPAAGYDPAVNRIRFAPGGTMAANSSFTIRFRARIE
jgi:hypothetical protein